MGASPIVRADAEWPVLMDRRTLTVLDKMLRQAEETMARLERLVKKTQRFETDHLKRLRRLERAALTCPNCGAILRCPACGHDPGAKP